GPAGSGGEAGIAKVTTGVGRFSGQEAPRRKDERGCAALPANSSPSLLPPRGPLTMSQYPTDVFRTSCGATAPLVLNVSGPGRPGGERRGFGNPFAMAGRDERSVRRMEDGGVRRQPAYLQQLGGRIFCVDLGSRRGIRWGGEARPAGWLRPGQGVQIGPFTVEPAAAARAGKGPGDWA